MRYNISIVGATPTVPPLIPGNRGRGFEKAGSSAEILPFKASTSSEPEDSEASLGTTDGPDAAVVGEVFDYKVHGGKAFRVRINSKDRQKGPSRLFRPGSSEHATLQAMKKYSSRGRDAIRGAAKRTTGIRRK